MNQPARTSGSLGYREQEYAAAPMLGVQKFPLGLQRAIKVEAAASGRTITEVLADELEAVATRLERDPSAKAPERQSRGDLISLWTVKHFPASLRERLKALARVEGIDLYLFLIRELYGAFGDGDA